MKPQAILVELLARLESQQGERIFITEDELNIWPNAIVIAMKSYGLITKTLSAKSTLCIGCEQQCTMPVEILINKSGEPRAFVVCDKRSDINRVPIPLNHLELWQLTTDSIAALLAKLLEIPHTKTGNNTESQWEVGIFKGKHHSSHMVLLANSILQLVLAGYEIPLIEVLSFDGTSFKIDKQKLTKLVDNPAAGGGNSESAMERKDRLIKRKRELQNKGHKNFLKIIADEEGISDSRVKQLLANKTKASTKDDSW